MLVQDGRRPTCRLPDWSVQSRFREHRSWLHRGVVLRLARARCDRRACILSSRGAIGQADSQGAWTNPVAGAVAAGRVAGNGDGDKGAIAKVRAGVAAMTGIAPDDVIADMVAAQLVSAHTAAMDCYKRAAAGDVPLGIWREALSQANKLSRTSAALIEALNRHRGRTGQQTVRVEHVTVNEGGQAIVGPVATGGRGGMTTAGIRLTPRTRPPRCGARTRRGTPCRSPAMANGRCRMHGGPSPGAPPGDRHPNWRHGGYSREAIERRREVAALVREMRALVRQLGV